MILMITLTRKRYGKYVVIIMETISRICNGICVMIIKKTLNRIWDRKYAMKLSKQFGMKVIRDNNENFE